MVAKQRQSPTCPLGVLVVCTASWPSIHQNSVFGSDPVDHLGRSLELDMTVVSHMTSTIQIVRNQQRLGAFPACEKRRVNITDGDRYARSSAAVVLMFLQQRLRAERGRGEQLGCDVEDS